MSTPALSTSMFGALPLPPNGQKTRFLLIHDRLVTHDGAMDAAQHLKTKLGGRAIIHMPMSHEANTAMDAILQSKTHANLHDHEFWTSHIAPDTEGSAAVTFKPATGELGQMALGVSRAACFIATFDA